MMANITYPSTKEKIDFLLKFDLLLILFVIMLYIPFTVFSDLVDIYSRLLIIILLSLYLLAKANLIKRRMSLKVFLVSISIMVLYYLYYFIGGIGILNDLIVQLLNVFFMLSIYLYIIVGTRIETATKLFVKIILLVSIITIISFVGANTGIILFPQRILGGYDIGFNYILGGISYGSIFNRPQFYFAEPSYLGFFLGFSILFLKQLDWIKKRRIKLLIVFISGMMVFSFTFYSAIIIGIISELIYMRLKSFLNPNTVSKIFLISFIVISTIYVTQLDKVGNTFFSTFQTTFNDRQFRIETSLLTLQNMDYGEILLGKGTGFITSIDKTRNRSESDAYIRTFVENGLIILFIYLFIIYYFLKSNPSLLLFTLVALHSVILLETPFFILIIVLASIIGKENKSQVLLRMNYS